MESPGWLKRWWQFRYPFYCAGIAIGLALLWWPFSTQRNLDAWAEQLRREGIPADAVVYDLVIKKRNKAVASETMHLRYDVNGVVRAGEVGCWEVCLPASTPVRIWINPADPTDFVAEFGTLSGNRGRLQGGFGAAGFGLVIVSVGATIARLVQGRNDRRNRRATTAPVTASRAVDPLAARRRSRQRRRSRS